MFWKRLNYFITKVRRAWADGTLWTKMRRFLSSSVCIPLEVTVRHWRLAKSDRRLDIATGFSDHRGQAGHRASDPAHIHRIIAAYKASKQAQRSVPPAFQIRGLWAEWIDVNFRDLIRAFDAQNASALAALLENLHREQFTLGLGSSLDEYIRYRTSLTGRFYVRTVWCRYRDLFQSVAPTDTQVHFPLVGNPAGIYLNGQVIPIHAFRHAYHALEMAQWLQDIRRAVVVEIGGGIGAQAFQMVHQTGESLGKYVVFDIPEVAAICSYLLLSAFPDKRIRLFGEGSVSTSDAEDYDLAVFPHFSITELANNSVDLFHNACSFSEMDRTSSLAYMGVIERAGRGYFSHINHETRIEYRYPDGSTSTNAIGSELAPDSQKFRRIFKKPRVFCLPEDRWYPAFEYLYERRRNDASTR